MTQDNLLPVEAPVQEKWLKLLDFLVGLPSAAVAFSGGVDSSLVSVAAHRALGDRMLAVTIVSPVEVPESVEVARRLAAQFGFPHRLIDINHLENEAFLANPPERCYLCKQVNFGRIVEVAREGGYQYVLEGSNADDVSDYRPGRQASLQLGVLSPLEQAGPKKPEIRALARALGMANWDRPSSPCLATRFPYGTRITREGLEKVAAGEAYLRAQGFRQVRTRYGGVSVRLEVPASELGRLLEQRTQVVAFFKQLGYTYVLVDWEGYRQGSLNEVLPGLK